MHRFYNSIDSILDCTFYPGDSHLLLNYSSVSEHYLDGFYVLTFVNNDIIGVHIYIYVLIGVLIINNY